MISLYKNKDLAILYKNTQNICYFRNIELQNWKASFRIASRIASKIAIFAQCRIQIKTFPNK